ncbi:phosphoribosylanthranilate isomerase [Daejeonella sp.]|uniref:phosphoribosylanthranilate isomerase n=1 Tax=Daejeonella sp. TaxID=2805397 RepID=UPI0030BDB74B
MKEPKNIRGLVELKPDYVGFIFYPHSKRFVGDLEVGALAAIPGSIKKTGVFVNEAMDVIADQVINYDLDAVQLHGDESPDFCRSFRKFLHNMQTEKHVEIIKAFGISEEFDFATLSGYEDFADFFLFDTKTSDHGGSGRTFDWKILEKYHGKKPYFLSGGLSSDNIHGINEIKDVRFYGVDLNSKFETDAGIKDIDKLRSVFERVRS